MVDAEVLDLLIGGQCLEPLFAAVTGQFIAAERELHVEADAEGIDPYLADTQLFADRKCCGDIAGMNTRDKAER